MILERFILDSFEKINTDLLDSNLFDIITKFMYTGIYKGFPYNLDQKVIYAGEKKGDSFKHSYFKHYYSGYKWIDAYYGDPATGGYYIAMGYNGTKEYIGIGYPIGPDLCYYPELDFSNETNLQRSIDKSLSYSAVTTDPLKFIEESLDSFSMVIIPYSFIRKVKDIIK